MNLWMRYPALDKACPAARELMRRAFETSKRNRRSHLCGLFLLHDDHESACGGRCVGRGATRSRTWSRVRAEARFGLVTDVTATQLGLVRTLRGLTPIFGCFDDGQFSELQIERRFSGKPRPGARRMLVLDPQAAGAFLCRGLCDGGRGLIARANRCCGHPRSLFETRSIIFFNALSHAAFLNSMAPDQHAPHLAAIAADHRQLQVWAQNCPENSRTAPRWVGAEIARLEGRDVDAMRLYEQANPFSADNGFDP